MKFFQLAVATILFISTSVFGDLAEGHWISHKIDEQRKVIVTYENWFETDETGTRVFKYKILAEAPIKDEPIDDAKPSPIPVPTGHWYCFAHDYIDGHSPEDPKDDSCINAHYKGTGHTLDQAMQAALRRCTKNGRAKTCNLRKQDCYSEKSLPDFAIGVSK